MSEARRSVGLLDSLRRLAETAAGVAETRLALLSTDLEEAARRFAAFVLWGAVALFFFSLGVLLAAVFVVVLFWDSHRLLAIAAASALFFAASVIVVTLLGRASRTQARLFSATLGELAKDRAALRAAP